MTAPHDPIEAPAPTTVPYMQAYLDGLRVGRDEGRREAVTPERLRAAMQRHLDDPSHGYHGEEQIIACTADSECPDEIAAILNEGGVAGLNASEPPARGWDHAQEMVAAQEAAAASTTDVEFLNLFGHITKELGGIPCDGHKDSAAGTFTFHRERDCRDD